MTHPRELIELITRLRKSGQPLKQVRLLLNLWKAIDEIPRRERGRLMRRLGLEGGEELIQTFLGRGGRLDPEMAAAAIQLLESISPARLKSLTSRHLSPEETEQVVEMLKDTLRRQAGNLAPPPRIEHFRPPQPKAPPPSSEPYVRRPAIPVDVDNEIDEVVEIAAEVVDSAVGHKTLAPGLGVTAGAAAAAAAATTAARPGKDSVDEAGQPKEPAKAESEPEGADEETPAPESAREEEAAPPVVAEPAAPPERPLPQPRPPVAPAPRPAPESEVAPEPESSEPGWYEQLQSIAQPTSRLRAFRNLQDSLERLEPDQARDLAELFPPGWMRRRVLQTVFGKGLVPAAAAAELLRDMEPTPVTYLWLAGSLLENPDLTPSQQDTLIDQAPSATIKRLLRARCGA